MVFVTSKRSRSNECSLKFDISLKAEMVYEDKIGRQQHLSIKQYKDFRELGI
jgi:hypothetical protein